MKILVTGGAGFIARNVSEQLSSSYNLVSRTSSELNLLDSDTVSSYLRDNSFDVIIHTATYDAAPKCSTKDPSQVFENNTRMFNNIVRCKDCFGKMIYFGSGAEFSREHWQPKMTEDYFDRWTPTDQYGFSKYTMTKYALTHDNVYNLRLFGVFGKYEDWRYRFISNMCCHALLDIPLQIKQNRVVDFLYIDDLVTIVDWFINNSPKRTVYNVCSGMAFDFKAIAQKVISASGKNLDIVAEAEGMGAEYSGDNSVLVTDVPGVQFTPMDEAIKKLYSWYEKHKACIDKDELHEYI